MKLIKYRDWGMPTYTYFWVTENDTLLSPYFNSEKEATDWLEEQKNKLTDPVKDY